MCDNLHEMIEPFLRKRILSETKEFQGLIMLQLDSKRLDSSRGDLVASQIQPLQPGQFWPQTLEI